MRAIAAVGCLLIGGCQWVSGTEAHFVAGAQKVASASLRDPASAQFRNVRVVAQKDGRNAVCGEINGRNAYGGYAGFHGFYVLAGEAFFEPNTASASTVEDATAAYSWVAESLRVCT